MANAHAFQPDVGDVVIRKLDAVTHVLCVEGQRPQQYYQWDRVMREALRLAAERDVNVWIHEDGYDMLLHGLRLEPTP
jgi:hypothetical protein